MYRRTVVGQHQQVAVLISTMLSFVLWKEIAVWSRPSGVLFTAECEASSNPCWSKAKHSEKKGGGAVQEPFKQLGYFVSHADPQRCHLGGPRRGFHRDHHSRGGVSLGKTLGEHVLQHRSCLQGSGLDWAVVLSGVKGSGLLDLGRGGGGIQQGDKLSEVTFGRMQNIFLRVGSEAAVHQRIILGLCNSIYRERKRKRERWKTSDLVFVYEKSCWNQGRRSEAPNESRLRHLTWMCLRISRNCRYTHRTIRVNTVFSIN